MICLLPNCCFLSETSRLVADPASPRVSRRRRSASRRTAERTSALLTEAGVDYDIVGPRMDAERMRGVRALGSRARSAWPEHVERRGAAHVRRRRARLLREHRVQVAVTGWTLTALLSTRLAGIPLVTEHAGSFLPPMFERRLLPAPSHPVGMPLERWLPERLRRRLFNARVADLDEPAGFNRVAAELGVDGVPSFPALLLGDLSLVTDVPRCSDSRVPRSTRGFRATRAGIDRAPGSATRGRSTRISQAPCPSVSTASWRARGRSSTSPSRPARQRSSAESSRRSRRSTPASSSPRRCTTCVTSRTSASSSTGSSRATRSSRVSTSP